jgi:hypothetical protein
MTANEQLVNCILCRSRVYTCDLNSNTISKVNNVINMCHLLFLEVDLEYQIDLNLA